MGSEMCIRDSHDHRAVNAQLLVCRGDHAVRAGVRLRRVRACGRTYTHYGEAACRSGSAGHATGCWWWDCASETGFGPPGGAQTVLCFHVCARQASGDMPRSFVFYLGAAFANSSTRGRCKKKSYMADLGAFFLIRRGHTTRYMSYEGAYVSLYVGTSGLACTIMVWLRSHARRSSGHACAVGLLTPSALTRGARVAHHAICLLYTSPSPRDS